MRPLVSSAVWWPEEPSGCEGRNIIPRRIPVGVVMANKMQRMAGRTAVLCEPPGSVDIRMPRERPSNSW